LVFKALRAMLPERWSSFYVSIDAFAQAAAKGTVHRTNHTRVSKLIGSGRTPLSMGLRSGYSIEDVCRFYVARRTEADGTAHTSDAFEDYWRDVVFEDSISEFLIPASTN